MHTDIISKGGPVKVYKDITITNNVESQFLYCTILGDDLVPFTFRRVRMVVLPIKNINDQYIILSQNQAKEHGFLHLSKWLAKVDHEWDLNRKSKESNVLKSLDFRSKLTTQSTKALYRVLYPSFQRVSVACIVKTNEACKYEYNNRAIRLQNFVADSGMYYFETDNLDEAYYLCSVLNSSEIDNRLSLLRYKDQKNHPNVHKKIFDVAPIPKYDQSNPLHKELAALGEQAEIMVKDWLSKNTETLDIGKTRRIIRNLLTNEIYAIDNLTNKLLLSRIK